MAVIASQLEKPTEPYGETVKGLLKIRKGSVRQLVVPAANYLCIKGASAPFGEEFARAAEALLSLGYAIKFLPKSGRLPEGYIKEYGVGPLEALFPFGHNEWSWKLLLMQPPFVTEEVLEEARLALVKRRRPRYDHIGFGAWEEGCVYQTLHVGRRSDMDEAGKRLNDEIRRRSLSKYSYQHEIYLTDPLRLDDPESRTILRYPVLDPVSLSQ